MILTLQSRRPADIFPRHHGVFIRVCLCRVLLRLHNDPALIAVVREAAAAAAACGKNIAVYQDYKGTGQVRAIYFSGTYANLPMMEGRFFQESDFTAGNRCAVIGKDRRGEIIRREGKAYIELQGVPFEVLGVMGPEEETAFDSLVMINGLAEPS